MSRLERAIVYQGADAATRLHDLDPTLEVEDFLEAQRYGSAEGHQSTPFEPVTSQGWIRWAKTVGSLRETESRKGWRDENPQGNYALTVNPSETVAIVCSSGDENTGLDDPLISEPQCKNPKGELVEVAVNANQQLQFADVDPSFVRIAEPKRLSPPPWETWIFLYFEDPVTGAMRCELSLPTEMTGKYVTGWKERIIFGSPEDKAKTRVPTADDQPLIDVPVERRAG